MKNYLSAVRVAFRGWGVTVSEEMRLTSAAGEVVRFTIRVLSAEGRYSKARVVVPATGDVASAAVEQFREMVQAAPDDAISCRLKRVAKKSTSPPVK